MNFSPDEFRMRLESVRAAMGKQDIDILVICDPSNLYYVTGYDGWSFYVPQAVLVSLEAELPIWIGRAMDANAARISTSLPSDSIVAYADEYVHSQTQHPFDRVGEYVCNRGWGKQRIALEMDAAYFTAAGYEALRGQLPNAQFCDSNNLVNWVRFVKSPQEVEYMRQAARIIEQVFEVAADVIAPGVRQCDAVAKIYEAQIRGTDAFGGDYTAIAPMLPTGLGTSTPHLTWTDAPFVTGETTILELAAARLRYHCPMARTLHLGNPPPHIRDTANVIIEGIDNVLSVVKPGVSAEHLEHVWRRTVEPHGIVKKSRMGYSIGIGYPPDWGERTMSIRPGDTTVLHANTTFHLMPGIWADDWGVEISEPILVTDTGCERLAEVSQALIVK